MTIKVAGKNVTFNTSHLQFPINVQSFPHPFVLLVSALIPCWVWGVAGGVGEALSLGARGQSQRGHQRWLHFAEDLGAETKAVGELPEAQGLQVTGQSRHHAQQQLRKMLCLDLYVGLLEMLEKTDVKWGLEGASTGYLEGGGPDVMELRLLTEADAGLLLKSSKWLM